MFGHKVSKVGYVFCSLGMLVIFLVTAFSPWVFAAYDTGNDVVIKNAIFAANLASAVGAWMTIGGLVMIACGILARGFERLEAALLLRTPGDKS